MQHNDYNDYDGIWWTDIWKEEIENRKWSSKNSWNVLFYMILETKYMIMQYAMNNEN